MKFNNMLYYDDLSSIEKLLQDNLFPVRPKPEFVAGLRQKLSQLKPEPPVLPRGWRTLIVSIAGIFSGLLIVGAIIRAIAGLIGMVSLMRQIRPARRKRAASASPA
jgi:uncharacterized membrane protein YccC